MRSKRPTLVAPPESRPANGDPPTIIVGVPPPCEEEDALDSPFPEDDVTLNDPPAEPAVIIYRGAIELKV